MQIQVKFFFLGFCFYFYIKIETAVKYIYPFKICRTKWSVYASVSSVESLLYTQKDKKIAERGIVTNSDQRTGAMTNQLFTMCPSSDTKFYVITTYDSVNLIFFLWNIIILYLFGNKASIFLFPWRVGRKTHQSKSTLWILILWCIPPMKKSWTF